MKKTILFLFVAMMVITGCNNSNQFKVKLNLDNADKKTVYLYKTVDGNTICIDTAVFAGKTAVLTAPNDDPHLAYFLIFDQREDCGNFSFFTENQNTTISGDIDDMQHWTVKGCPIMEEWNAYRESFLPFEEQIMSLFNESNDVFLAGDSVKAAELYAQFEAKMKTYDEMRMDYLRSHPDSYLTHFMLDQEKERLDFETVKEISGGFTTESIYSKSIQKFLEVNGRMQVGQPFIDFTLKTADGTDVHLAEVIKNNTLTLVDFWASWCVPCRQENPFVRAAYEKYHKKGLEIVGVSLDRDEADWLKAVKDDALPWNHVRDLDHTVSPEYLVKYIPSNFLFNSNGIMVAKNLRGEELEAKLAEILNQ